MDSVNLVTHDLSPFFRVYKDGSVEDLFGAIMVPPPPLDHHLIGVSSKDVLVLPDSGVAARIYLPKIVDTRRRLPLLVYFHGGCFVLGSTTSPTYHYFLTRLVADANIVVVSVDYRRAPQHPLPTAYDDSWAVLQWIAAHNDGLGPETWLFDYADFDRVFIGGDSAGANIAHHMAMRAGPTGLDHGVKIYGSILIHPYFWGSEPIGSEENSPMGMSNMVDRMWRFACPSSKGSDDPLINPTGPSAPSLKGLGCTQVLVCIAEKDILRDRGLLYYDSLVGSGWGGDATVLEIEGVGHVFHLVDLTCEKALIMMKHLACFLNS